MQILILTSLLVLATGAFAQDEREKAPPPDPEVVEAALEALERGFEAEEVAETVEAINARSRVVAPEVAQLIARKGLRHREREVRLATFAALGGMRLEEAREALEKLARERKLEKDPELMIGVLRAVARHADARSLPVLADVTRSVGEGQVVAARILCVANVRAPESVEALFGAMKKAGRQQVQARMPDFRLALMVLTGVDRGLSQDEWLRWWNENKKDLELPEKMPVLPDLERARWNNFWGLEREYPRPPRRGDRGRE